MEGRPAPFATSYVVGREDNRTMLPTLKHIAAGGYQGPVQIEVLKGGGLLKKDIFNNDRHQF